MLAASTIDCFRSQSCKAFLHHWDSLPKIGLIPLSSAFLDHPPSALMPYVILQEVMPEGLMVRFMGTAMVDRWQHDLTGSFMGKNLPKARHDVIHGNGKTVATHPCGIRQVGEIRSSTGRAVMFEAVLLPLGVESGRFPRVVAFSHMLDELGRQEHNDSFFRSDERQWLDVGAGVPPSPPQA